MNKQRYYYLDILKTIAIIFVCSYHFSWIGNCAYTEQGLTNMILFKRFFVGIHSICIPIFFMVNGALLLNSKMNFRKHIRKMVVLLVQFWIWRAITIGILGLHSGIQINNIGMINILNGIFLFGGIEGVDMSHFWFIPTLISIYIIYPIMIKTFSEENKHIFEAFLLILFVLCFLDRILECFF